MIHARGRSRQRNAIEIQVEGEQRETQRVFASQQRSRCYRLLVRLREAYQAKLPKVQSREGKRPNFESSKHFRLWGSGIAIPNYCCRHRDRKKCRRHRDRKKSKWVLDLGFSVHMCDNRREASEVTRHMTAVLSRWSITQLAVLLANEQFYFVCREWRRMWFLAGC